MHCGLACEKDVATETRPQCTMLPMLNGLIQYDVTSKTLKIFKIYLNTKLHENVYKCQPGYI